MMLKMYLRGCTISKMPKNTSYLYESRVRLSYEGAYFSTMIKFMHVSDSSNTCMYTTTRKGVPQLRGPALVRLCASDKKWPNILQTKLYWLSSWAKIPNVQDIIIERTKETRLSSTCRPIPSITIAGDGQHLCNTCQWNVLPRVSFTPERTVTFTDKSVDASIYMMYFVHTM